MFRCPIHMYADEVVPGIILIIPRHTVDFSPVPIAMAPFLVVVAIALGTDIYSGSMIGCVPGDK